jgi:hypothetical protein
LSNRAREAPVVHAGRYTGHMRPLRVIAAAVLGSRGLLRS